ncbi:hypothetical protein H6F90_17120 [Trichocoleus sp. FACHB-591]|uniref:hypothetical protein n=1 Tax=Trichocoleus sp. FACHB-591 TaxID=2692872 RepID=UPI0016842009|nr:hypothetical protein [Trichocoleus sp. FACHB-591]MBD2096826.1 hypothetical protein [Trichocoleus sp. FACHB-591]
MVLPIIRSASITLDIDSKIFEVSRSHGRLQGRLTEVTPLQPTETSTASMEALNSATVTGD